LDASSLPSSVPSSIVTSASSSVSSSATTTQTSSLATSTISESSTTTATSDTPLSSETTSMDSEPMLNGGVTLTNKWFQVMGGINATSYYSVPITLTTDLTSKKLTEINLIYESGTNQLYGVGYEALVNGFVSTVRFRVGFRLNLYTGFECLNTEHSEHSTRGGLIINALKNNLAGREATFANAVAAITQASVTRTGQSVTYDRIMPAIEVMVLHYSSEIA